MRSVKQECLSKLILFGENSLRRALVEHYHAERNHQGKGNVLLFPLKDTPKTPSRIDASMPATPWRTPELLLPGRMNILTVRGLSKVARDDTAGP